MDYKQFKDIMDRFFDIYKEVRAHTSTYGKATEGQLKNEAQLTTELEKVTGWDWDDCLDFLNEVSQKHYNSLKLHEIKNNLNRIL